MLLDLAQSSAISGDENNLDQAFGWETPASFWPSPDRLPDMATGHRLPETLGYGLETGDGGATRHPGQPVSRGLPAQLGRD
jgi:hypothetical protein